MMEHFSINRREFIQGTGALLVCASTAQSQSNNLPGTLNRNNNLDTWIRVNRNGTIEISPGKVELGQGIVTALAQVAADELKVDIERIHMIPVDTDRSPDEGRTVGSNSMIQSGNALRVAAAHARQILIENASVRMNTGIGQLAINDGIVSDRRSGRMISYWELLSDGRFNAEADGEAQLLDSSEYRYAGVSVKRFDIPGKVFGGQSYVHDIRLPGMLHARIVRGPRRFGTLGDVDVSSVTGRPGVVNVIRDGNFLAVVAEKEHQAREAAEQLRAAATWSYQESVHGSASNPHLLRELETTLDQVSLSNPDGSETVREYQAEFSKPFLSHGSLGPSCAVAQYENGRVTVWNHSQGQHQLKGAIADVLGLDEENVRLIFAESAGCYGHNGADDAGCDAALIAYHMPGAPIRLLWSRSDEFLHEPYGSGMSYSINVGINADNRINRWHCDLWSCSYSTRPSGGDSAGGLHAAQEKTNPLPFPIASDGRQPNGSADRNAVPLYTIPNQDIKEHLIMFPPLRNSALRGLGAFGNVFVIESMMDIVAHDLGEDPVDFRLRHLDDYRARDVLIRARELAVAASPIDVPANMRLGRGSAFAQYKNSNSYVAVILDVLVNINNGQVRVVRAFSSADVGEIINPNGVSNQIEGGIVQATSWTLKERVLASANGSQSRDWSSYPILTFSEVPEIEVSLINRPNERFLGAGEGTQGPTGGAIANAIYDAVGVRLYDLPLTPDKVLAGINS